MEIKVKALSSQVMEVIFRNDGATIKYDPMVFATIDGRREMDVEDGFADTLLQAAVDVVEFRKRDTDTSDAIRRLFERLPEGKKSDVMNQIVADSLDEHVSLHSRITELEEKLYRIGMMEAERDTLQEMSDAASVKIFELEEKIEALEARIAVYKFGEEE